MEDVLSKYIFINNREKKKEKKKSQTTANLISNTI